MFRSFFTTIFRGSLLFLLLICVLIFTELSNGLFLQMVCSFKWSVPSKVCSFKWSVPSNRPKESVYQNRVASVKHNLIYSLITIRLATCFDPTESSSGLLYKPVNVRKLRTSLGSQQCLQKIQQCLQKINAKGSCR